MSKRGGSVGERLLLDVVAQAGFPDPEPEYRFHPTRRWRFDLAWPALKVAFEREGLAPGGRPGRHQRAAGYAADCEKYNEAQLLGWVVVRATARMIESGVAARQLLEALLLRSA